MTLRESRTKYGARLLVPVSYPTTGEHGLHG